MASYHAMPAGEVLAALGTDAHKGLSAEEATKRRQEFGLNELRERPGRSPFLMFLTEFKDFLVLILLAAAAVSAFLGEWLDAAAIFAIVILNAVIGFSQEFKAEKAIKALRKLLAPAARVIRAGHEKRILARELVPGDVVLLEAGDRIPADGRLLQTVAFRTDEAPLTGESAPVDKDAVDTLAEEAMVADRRNITFMGTTAVHGRARAVVVATGMRTEFGRIAQLVQEVEKEKTPLQKQLETLGKQLGSIFLAVSGVVFVFGYLSGVPLLTMFLTSVSLAIGAVPEGLPAIVTIAFAIGVHRMAKRHSLIRRLPAAETLGGSTIICSDKTGTMTKNEMTVRRAFAGGKWYAVTGTGYEPAGEIQTNGQKADVQEPALEWLLHISALCNNASLEHTPEGKLSVIGDPTEGCLLTLAQKGGVEPKRLEEQWPRVGELPFESERKRMTTLHRAEGATYALVKGAPELLLERCTQVVEEGRPVELTPERRERILAGAREMAGQALRVLGFAYRPLPASMSLAKGDHGLEEEVESNLAFVGLVGMIDPPREEVREAIGAARAAGIRVIMITGDHEATAVAIARELGLLEGEDSRVLTGAQLEKLSEGEFAQRVQEVRVYARVSPEHKLRIVNALKATGTDVVAMTGDGVNDAPALKRADIGVAMGITGTDVTKEASDLVITDDNFASIVAAVEEGRVIFDNIKKSVRYLISCNIGEVATVFAGTLAGFPLILLPLQILWMNLVTDALPALALGVEPPEPDTMRKPPRNPKEPILTRAGLLRMSWVGALLTACTLASFAYGLYTATGAREYVVALSRTAAFNTIVVFQLFFSLSARSERHTFASLGWRSNKWLWAAFLVGLALELVVIYESPLEPMFGTVELPLSALGVSLGLASLGFILPELTKLVERRRTAQTI